MAQYLVAIHHPDDYDASLEEAAMHRDIDALNDEMVAAGLRVFVGGLRPAAEVVSLKGGADGAITESVGPALPGTDHVGGFWVLDVPDLDAACVWGRKAAIACRAPVEVRAFY